MEMLSLSTIDTVIRRGGISWEMVKSNWMLMSHMGQSAYEFLKFNFKNLYFYTLLFTYLKWHNSIFEAEMSLWKENTSMEK